LCGCRHSGKEFFGALVSLMSSGPCMALCLARANAVGCWRGLMGPTNVAVAKLEAPSSLRALYGTEGAANATHGSKTPEAAAAEIPFFFPRIAPTTLLSNEEAKAQLQAQVAPLLSEALVELAKAKPQEPLLWLAQKLAELNPEKPPESEQSGYDLAKAEGAREVFDLIDTNESGTIEQDEFHNALMQLGLNISRDLSDQVRFAPRPRARPAPPPATPSRKLSAAQKSKPGGRE